MSEAEFQKLLAANSELGVQSSFGGPVQEVRCEPHRAAIPLQDEYEYQQAVIARCDALGEPYSLIYAIPNGQVRPGQRRICACLSPAMGRAHCTLS
jgi:hypothetical protein